MSWWQASGNGDDHVGGNQAFTAKGADYAENEIVGAETVRASGGRVVRVPLVDGQSTSRLIRRGAALSSPPSKGAK